MIKQFKNSPLLILMFLLSWCLFFYYALPSLAASQHTKIIYVNHQAIGKNNGTSWQDAYTDLQTAIANASTGFDIWVAQGIYYPTHDDNRDVSFQLFNNIRLFGGFSGTEINCQDRKIDQYPTVLSGDINSSAPDDNTYHVVMAHFVNETAVIDGFIITGGYANGGLQSSPESYGGGVYCKGGNPTIQNCQLTNNYALFGAGIYIQESSPVIQFCQIYLNDAKYFGGGAYAHRAFPKFQNCLIYQNQAIFGGGALYHYQSSPMVCHCVLAYNASDQGSAVFGIQTGQITIQNSIIWQNEPENFTFRFVPDYPPIVQSCIVPNTIQGDQCIYLDPQFVGLTDFRLKESSPAIDAGNPQWIPTDIFDLDHDNDFTEPMPFDYDHNPRCIDGNMDSHIQVDIGPFEFPSYLSIRQTQILTQGLSFGTFQIIIEFNTHAFPSTGMITIFDVYDQILEQIPAQSHQVTMIDPMTVSISPTWRANEDQTIFIQLDAHALIDMNQNPIHLSDADKIFSYTYHKIDPQAGTALSFDSETLGTIHMDSDAKAITELTFECWANADWLINKPMVVLSQGPDNTQLSWYFGLTPGNSSQDPPILTFGAYTHKWQTIGDTSSKLFQQNTWYHLAFSIQALLHKISFYQNGTLLSQHTLNDIDFMSCINQSSPYIIGNMESGQLGFVGQLDECRMWHTAKPASLIQNAMHIKCSCDLSNLWGYWQMNHVIGNQLIDIIGNHDISLNQQPLLVSNPIPFGPGCANTIISGSPHENACMKMTIQSMPNQLTWHVSQIHGMPNQIPDEPETVLTSRYWVMYSSESNSAITQLTLSAPDFFKDQDQNHPEYISLYYRPISDFSSWERIAVASYVDFINQTASFERVPTSGQFLMARYQDQTPPVYTSFFPENDKSFPFSGNLHIQFNEIITCVPDRSIWLVKSDGFIVETFQMPLAYVTGCGTKTIEIDPTNDLQGFIHYHVLIEPGAFVDLCDNPFEGITQTYEWHFVAMPPDVIFVNQNAMGKNNGLSWTDAFTDLSSALSTHLSYSEIWVAEGVYSPSHRLKPDNIRTAVFQIPDGTKLYGGFNGSENLRSQRDPQVYQTLLTASIHDNPDMPNAYHVLIGENISQQTIIDGFTILNSQADGALIENHQGGAVRLMNSQLIFSHCIFMNNQAIQGGAIYIHGGSPVLSHCRFETNGANEGGALFIENATPLISHCIFHSNKAINEGGAILIQGGHPQIAQSTLFMNNAPKGGAIGLTQLAQLSASNSIFYNNPTEIGHCVNQATPNQATIKYCLVQGGFEGIGNIDGNPVFSSETALRLKTGSPAIDAGSNALIPQDLGDCDFDHNMTELVSKDFDGNTRLMNGGLQAQAIVDMGPYEFPFSVPYAGNAIQLNGQSAYLSVLDHLDLHITQAFTLELWIKPLKWLENGQTTLVAKGNQVYRRANYILETSGLPNQALQFSWYANGWHVIQDNSGVQFQNGKWAHIALTVDTQTNKVCFYRNGHLLSEHVFDFSAYPLIVNQDPFTIGQMTRSDRKPFEGLIDDMRLWNVARSLNDIRTNMHTPLSGNLNGLKLYFQLNEQEGTLIRDLIGDHIGRFHFMDQTARIKSSIPYGTGTSVIQPYYKQIFQFPNTGFEILTHDTLTQTVMVSQIRQPPNIQPKGIAMAFDSQYWVIHAFQDQAASMSLKLTINEDLTTEDQSKPYRISLYSRDVTSDSDWLQVGIAREVLAHENSAIFDIIPFNQQFIVGRYLDKEPPRLSQIIPESSGRMLTNETIQLIFNEIITAVPGKSITLTTFSNDLFQVWQIPSPWIQGLGTPTITLVPHQDLMPCTAYSFEMDSGTFTDFSGNPVQGIALSDHIYFTAVPPDVIYVKSDIRGRRDGTWWTTAFKDLQIAIDHAKPGMQIRVAKGIYYPTRLTQPNNPRSATFVLPPHVTLYGGFSGDEQGCDDRDLAANETILSGEIGQPGIQDNAYHVITINNNDTACIDGFVIQDGNANGYQLEHQGGGIFIMNSQPVISRCIIRNNTASRYGGALTTQSSQPHMIQCIFMNNSAVNGGGVAYAIQSHSRFSHCLFYQNASETGTVLYQSEKSHAEFFYSIAFQNTNDHQVSIHNTWDSVFDARMSLIADSQTLSFTNNLDPRLTQPPILDLLPDSPCIDTKNTSDIALDLADANINGITNEPLSIDFYGRPRIADGSNQGIEIIDSGPFEFPDYPVVVRRLPQHESYGICHLIMPELTFNEFIFPNKGGFTITHEQTNQSQYIAITDSSCILMGQSVQLSPSLPFSEGTYFITLDPHAIIDQFGHDFPGITESNPWRFTCTTLDQHAGRTIQFFDQSGYIRVPYDAQLFKSQQITFEMWMRANDWSALNQIPLIAQGNKNQITGYYWGIQQVQRKTAISPTQQMVFSNPALGISEISAPCPIRLDDMAWHHVAVVLDFESIQFFINGMPFYKNSVSQTEAIIPQTTDDLYIGYDPSSASNFFSGEMDDIKIWSEPRNMEQLLSTMLNTPTTDAQHLMIYFQCNETDPHQVIDLMHGYRGMWEGSTVITRPTSDLLFPANDMIIMTAPHANPFTFQTLELNITEPISDPKAPIVIINYNQTPNDLVLSEGMIPLSDQLYQIQCIGDDSWRADLTLDVAYPLTDSFSPLDISLLSEQSGRTNRWLRSWTSTLIDTTHNRVIFKQIKPCNQTIFPVLLMDHTPPVIQTLSPATEGTITETAIFKISFSEPMQIQDGATVQLVKSDGTIIYTVTLPGVEGDLIDPFTLEIRPNYVFEFGTTIHVIIDANSLTDLSLNPFQGIQFATWSVTSVSPRIWFVSNHSMGQETGKFWNQAFSNLDQALVAAKPGHEIWVAKGTYSPTVQTVSGKPRTSTFVLKNGIALYGGFQGNETQRFQRNWYQNPTILSGTLSQTELSEHVYHVITARKLENITILSGFIISDGQATGVGENALGGGLFNDRSALRISQCIFRNNKANMGGAIYHYQSNSLMTHCAFDHNTAIQKGGAIYHSYYSQSILSFCTFKNNEAPAGSCLYNEQSQPNITNSILWHDSDSNNRPIYDDYNSQTTAANCIIQSGFSGTHIQNNNPLFIDTSSLQLQAISPAIDHANHALFLSDPLDLDGDNDVTEAVPFDLACMPRIDNGDSDPIAIADIGAFELSPLPVVIEFIPEDHSSPLKTDLPFMLIFNKPIFSQPGWMTIQDAQNNLIASIETTDPRIQIQDTRVTIQFDESLEPFQTYYVSVSKGAFDDGFGHSFSGVDPQTWQFQCQPADAFPGTALNLAACHKGAWLTDLYPNISTHDITISLWMYPNSWDVNQITPLIVKGDGSHERAVYYVGIGPDQSGQLSLFYASFNQNDQTIWDNSGISWPVNQWYHIAISLNSQTNQIHFYRNGTLLSTQDTHTLIPIEPNTPDPITIGAYWNSKSALFNGLMDEIRVIHASHTQTNIREMMNQPLSHLEKNLSVYCQMNEPDQNHIINLTIDQAGMLTPIQQITKVQSNIPFGPGQSQTWTNQSLVGDLDSVGLQLSRDPDDKQDITITKLSHVPNTMPLSCIKPFTNQYWIITGFTAQSLIQSLTLSHVIDIQTSDQDTPQYISLYGRPGNSSGTWVRVSTSTNINASSQTVNFSSLSPVLMAEAQNKNYPGIQFILGREIDETRPYVTHLIPGDEGIISVNDPFRIVFSEPVRITQELSIQLRTETNELIEEFVYPSQSIQGDGSTTIVIQPSQPLNNGIRYTLMIGPNAFIDLAGNPFLGIEDASKWNVMASPANVIFVKSHAINNPDGRWWSTAYTSLQEALNQTKPGFEIWISKGTYTPDHEPNQIKLSTFQIPDGITILGGFEGHEPYAHERNWQRNPTILSGLIDNEWVYHVVTAEQVQSTLISGIQIENGKATGAIGIHDRGAAMRLIDSNLIMSNCLIQNNTAQYGAAIHISHGQPEFSQCVIINNQGTALASSIVHCDQAEPLFTQCTFANNNAREGAVFINQNSKPMIVNSIIWNNTPFQTGLINDDKSFPDIQYSIIQGGYHGLGTLSKNPQFRSLMDLRLAYDSPAIDGGALNFIPLDNEDLDHDAITQEPIPFDYLRVPRIWKGRPSQVTSVDMGAYEFHELVPILFDPLPESKRLNDQQVIMEWNSPVHAGNGNIVIFQDDQQLTVLPTTDSQIAITQTQVVITPKSPLQVGRLYRIQIEPNALISDSGQGYTNVVGMPAWQFQYYQTERLPQQALLFQSNASEIQFNTIQILPNQPFTLEAWVNITASNKTVILLRSIKNNIPALSCIVTQDAIMALMMQTANGFERIFETLIEFNTWQHIALSYQNGLVHLFVNGESRAMQTDILFMGMNTLSLGDATDSGNRFEGMMDEIRLWSFHRSPEDIRNTMHVTLTGTISGLHSYWQCNANEIFQLMDNAGISHSLALSQIDYIPSTVPLGPGVSHSTSVSSGWHEMGKTGLSIWFQNPNDQDVTATRLDTLPNQLPDLMENTTIQSYWIIHAYGSDSFLGDFVFPIAPDMIQQIQGNPEHISLFWRETGSQGPWLRIAIADTIDSDKQTVQFSQIHYTGQMIIVPMIDNDPPKIVSKIPQNHDTHYLSVPVQITFSEPVLVVPQKSITITQSNGIKAHRIELPSPRVTGNGDYTLSIHMADILNPDTCYVLTIEPGALIDHSSHQFPGLGDTLSYAFTLVPDNTLFVDYLATGLSNGSSWSHAYTDLQMALDHSVKGDSIRIAKGVYFPSRIFEYDDPRTATFVLPNGVNLYGGFDGSECALVDRLCEQNATVLSGDIGQPQDTSDNAYHVLQIAPGQDPMIIDAIHITKGNANGNNSHNKGGAIRIDACSNLLISQSTCFENTATQGGGIYAVNSQFTIVNSDFFDNQAQAGGGMYHDQSKGIFSHCIFSNNQSNQGGALFQSNSQGILVTQSVFHQNQSNLGGGLYNQTGKITVYHTIFWDNIGSSIFNDNTTILTLRNSLLPEPDYTGSDIIHKNPCFVGDRDYHLQPISPAIDAGTDLYIPIDYMDIDYNGSRNERVPLDRDGLSRLVNGNNDSLVKIDIGPYEFPANPAVVRLFPVPNSTAFGWNHSLRMVFNRDVMPNSGEIQIVNTQDQSVFEAFSVLDPRVVIHNNYVDFHPIQSFHPETTYAILIPSSAFMNTTGQSFQGFDKISEWQFTYRLPDLYAGQCIQLDGQKDTYQVQSFDYPESDSFSCETWVFPNIGQGTLMMGLLEQVTVFKMTFACQEANCDISAYIGPTTTIQGTQITPQSWHHIVLSLSDNKLQLLIDGQVIDSIFHGIVFPGMDTLFIGSTEGRYSFFHGQLDELRFWTLPRTVFDFREGSHRIPIDQANGLFAYFQWNQWTGNETRDCVGDFVAVYEPMDLTPIVVNSPIPVAQGNSQTITQTDQMGQNSEIGMVVTFKQTGIQDITLSKLNTMPLDLPEDMDQILDAHIWVGQYSGKSNQSADITFYIDAALTINDETHPEEISLYSRPVFSTKAWTRIALCDGVDLQFNSVHFSNIPFPSQFMIGRYHDVTPPQIITFYPDSQDTHRVSEPFQLYLKELVWSNPGTFITFQCGSEAPLYVSSDMFSGDGTKQIQIPTPQDFPEYVPCHVIIQANTWIDLSGNGNTTIDTWQFNTVSDQIIFVSEQAKGNQTGLSWKNAFTTLDQALSIAQADQDIWIAKGTYYPTQTSNRNISFQLSTGVDLYGGFQGNEFLVASRQPYINDTILSGAIENTSDAYSFHVVSATQVHQCTIDGLIITHGNANGLSGLDTMGGGLLTLNSQLRIENCRFMDNKARQGGAAALLSNSHSNFIKSIFLNNIADTGGAIYHVMSSPLIDHCLFMENKGIQGGALSLAVDSNALIRQSTFYNNGPVDFNNANISGLTIICSSQSSPQISNSIIWDTFSTQVERIDYLMPSLPVIQHSIIRGGYLGTGNLDIDPLFMLDNQLHPQSHLMLSMASPAIDQGARFMISESDLASLTETDFNGSPRLCDGNLDGLAVPDMGAFEVYANHPAIVMLEPSHMANTPNVLTACYVQFNQSVNAGSGQVTIIDSKTSNVIEYIPANDPRIKRDNYHVWIYPDTQFEINHTYAIHLDNHWMQNSSQAASLEITHWSFSTYQPDQFIGTALDLQSGQWVEIQHNDHFSMGMDSLTIEAWINVSNSTQLPQMIIAKGGTDNQPGFSFGINEQRLFFQIIDQLGHMVRGTGQHVLTEKTWHHIALQINRNQPLMSVTILVNGNIDCVVSEEFTHSIESTLNLSIGARIGESSATDFFDGQVDEIRIFRNYQSHTMIREHAHHPLMGDEPGLIAYYQLNEGQGDVIHDTFHVHQGQIHTPQQTNSQWVSSLIPFGQGQTLSLTMQSETLNFTGTDIGLRNVPIDTTHQITVSKINISPNQLPPYGFQGIDTHFWVIHSTTDKPITATMAISMDSENGLLHNASKWVLFHRQAHTNQGWNWKAISQGDSQNEIVFNTIDVQGQFLLGVDDTSPELLSNLPTAFTPTDTWDQIQLNFSEPVTSVASKSIKIYRMDGTACFHCVFPSQKLMGENTPQLILTIDQSIQDNAGYYIFIEPGAFQDRAGNVYAGISQPDQWYFYKGIHFVKWDAEGKGNGRNWLNAFQSIQPAIDLAKPGESIWVAQGIYTPLSYYEQTVSADLSIIISKEISILGGFSGQEIMESERNWTKYFTIISGQQSESVFSYHVIKITREARRPILDGLIIRDGQAIGELYPRDHGGGIFIHEMNQPEIRNCRIINNNARFGGGLYSIESNPRIVNCDFEMNQALNHGGGMFFETSSPQLLFCNIQANEAQQNGGGIYTFQTGDPIITHTIIKNNHAHQGAGLFAYDNSHPIIHHSLFLNNQADDIGGALYFLFHIRPLLNHCTLTQNSAQIGSGIFNDEYIRLTIYNSIIWDNPMSTSHTIVNQRDSKSLIEYSLIQGGYSGAGNIDKSPNFMSLMDPHLRYNSPAIDMGLNTLTPLDIVDINENNNKREVMWIDLDSNPRLKDGNLDQMIRVDMGVYEYPSIQPDPDIQLSHAITLLKIMSQIPVTREDCLRLPERVQGDAIISIGDLIDVLEQIGKD